MLGRRPSLTSRVRQPDLGRPVLSARAGAALGVLVVLVAILAIPFKEWITQRARISDLEAQIAWHSQRVAELTAARDRWSDPAYVEAQARARLRFVKVGEVGYVVLTDDPTTAQDTTATRPMASVPRGGPWWTAMWTTVEQAATPDESGGPLEAPAPAERAESYGQ